MRESRMPSQMMPVGVSERINSIDVLRGVALLGILVINIYFFALPGAVMFNPPAAGGFTGLNFLTWQFTSTFFLQKMMGIFSMLFGAGIILMSGKAEQNRKKFGAIHYRRMLWLLIFGLVHGYLLWHGDILFTYAICGMVLFLFRRRSPRLLIILSIIFFIAGFLMQFGSSINFTMVRDAAARAEKAIQNGKEIDKMQESMIVIRDDLESIFKPSEQEIQKEIDAYRGNFFEVLKFRLPETLMMQTQALFFFVFWRAMGFMLLGMALMKLDVFSAARSKRFYAILAIVGYTLGLPTVYYGLTQSLAHDFDYVYQFREGLHYNLFGGALTALGHVGVIMLICKAGLLKWLTAGLAAVGRTALSNYLLTSVVMTTIFYGYGLGLFGHIDRFYLMLFIPGMWVIQLIVSRVWLEHFKFGPAEWLWRSLTYRKKQMMRIAS